MILKERREVQDESHRKYHIMSFAGDRPILVNDAQVALYNVSDPSPLFELCADPRRPWWVNVQDALEWVRNNLDWYQQADFIASVEGLSLDPLFEELGWINTENARRFNYMVVSQAGLTPKTMDVLSRWHLSAFVRDDLMRTLCQVAIDAKDDTSVPLLQAFIESSIYNYSEDNDRYVHFDFIRPSLDALSAMAINRPDVFNMDSAFNCLIDNASTHVLAEFAASTPGVDVLTVQALLISSEISHNDSFLSRVKRMVHLFGVSHAKHEMDEDLVYDSISMALSRISRSSFETDDAHATRKAKFIRDVWSLGSLNHLRLLETLERECGVTTYVTIVLWLANGSRKDYWPRDKAISRLIDESIPGSRQSDMRLILDCVRLSGNKLSGATWAKIVRFFADHGTISARRGIWEAVTRMLPSSYGSVPFTIQESGIWFRMLCRLTDDQELWHMNSLLALGIGGQQAELC